MASKIALALIALIAVFAALTYWRAGQREADVMAAYPPEGEIIEVDGHPVHVVVRGSGPDLVLIHGASGSTRDMTFRLAGSLEDRYRVIVIDRPGFGYTPVLHNKGETLQEQADLFSRTAAQLGAERPLVLGQSYGGAVALAWAVYYPDRLSGLIPLAAASNIWPKPLSTLYKITSHPIGRALVVPMITAWVPESYISSSLVGVFAPQPVPEGYFEHFGPVMSIRRMSFAANARQRANILSEITEQSTRYGEISVPTEIVHGRDDLTVGYDLHSARLVTQIKGATLTPLEGMGHMPQHFALDEIGAAVDRAAARAGLR